MQPGLSLRNSRRIPNAKNRPQADSGWTNRAFYETSRPFEQRCRAPRPEPREESGLQFAASGRFLSPVPVRDEAIRHPDLPAAPAPRERRCAWPISRASVQFPGLRALACGATLPLNFDSPTDSRDPVARSSAFQRSAPSTRPSAPLPSPPSSSPCGFGWACVSTRPLGAVPEPVGPCFAGRSRRFRLGFVITLTRLGGLAIEPCERAVPEPVQDRCITVENRRYQIRKRRESRRFRVVHRFAAPALTGQGFAFFLELQPLVLGGGEIGAGLVELGHQPVEAGLVPGVEPGIVEALF